MRLYKIPSVFIGKTAVFYYSANNKNSNKAILILKGLFGKHIPLKIDNKNNKQLWENQLINMLQDEYNIFIFNTGRINTDDKKEAFIGKTYLQECEDVRNAFIFCKKKILKNNFYCWGAVVMSFGGTILLGCPDVLNSMQEIVMIGSGSGRSSTTAKPLLSTLPDIKNLLQHISKFKGSLYFLHGGEDSVVPLESQKNIYNSAEECFSRSWIEFPNLDHELNDPIDNASHTSYLIRRFIFL